MAATRLPGWLRLWLGRDKPCEGREAFRAALARRDEVEHLVARARLHRERNHFAERIASVLDEDDRRRTLRGRGRRNNKKQKGPRT